MYKRQFSGLLSEVLPGSTRLKLDSGNNATIKRQKTSRKRSKLSESLKSCIIQIFLQTPNTQKQIAEHEQRLTSQILVQETDRDIETD
ncbi:hypothetical protein DPMN_050286 [Dreissena polymorpha]|uniref:Uncharacterized protein n=1 Tax=Dreissena polymorpha TaxID=45954 RepID=A0A9D4HP45_DREPO|nr:hypothetical protein DPMN_050286 [Dreissena polymorpha]